MSDINWTTRQLEAIEKHGTQLLVSAAAGSGKTAVLVERVMRMVCDPVSPVDIDKLLIVTFTRAAAEEMRVRIARAITGRLVENPGNIHLQRQMTLIYRARITTVHGLCSRLLTSFGHVIGVDSFRIGDPNEISMLSEAVLEELLEERYNSDDDGFFELVEQTSRSRNDNGLADTLRETYKILRSHPAPSEWLENRLGDYLPCGSGIDSHIWVHIVINEFINTLKYYRSSLAGCVGEMAGTAFNDNYSPAFLSDIEGIDRLTKSSEDGWDALSNTLRAISFMRLKGVRGPVDERLKDRVSRGRNNYHKYINGMKSGILSISSSEAAGDLKALFPCVRSLFSLVQDYDDRLLTEKFTRGLLDFNDLEHLTLKLLCSRLEIDGENVTVEKTALAEELSRDFTEIMVDEYQDINLLQDTIITALSRSRENLFLVGDVKQSIYRFRMANPDIFVSRYDEAKNKDLPFGEAVDLSENFRSRSEVLGFANHVFSRIMQRELGETDYDEVCSLITGPNAPPPDPRYRSELYVIDMAGGGGDEEVEDDEVEDGEDGDDPERGVCEAHFAAHRIAEMLAEGFPVRDGGTVRPSAPEDYVILLRSYRNKSRYYEEALASRGIRSSTSVEPDYFATPEITCAMALLAIIENPRQDVWLLSAMRSPCFNFTASELAEIRLKSEGDFYDAVRGAAKTDRKSAGFLGFITRFRELSPDFPVHTLLWRIFEHTHLIGLFSAEEGGASRRDNLLFLFEAAKRYEQGESRGLFGFMRYLEASKENGVLSSAPLTEKGAGAGVRVMSVHNSKGLEFPVVFVCDCAHLFNQDDLKKSVLIHRTLGAGLKRREIGRGVEYTTLGREAITARIKNETLSEEMRVLYVALTRARDKLVVTMSFKEARRVLERITADDMSGRIPASLLAGDRSTGLWMLRALCDREGFKGISGEDCRDDVMTAAVVDAHSYIRRGQRRIDETYVAPVDPVLTALILERLRFEYGFRDAAGTPSKITATALKGGLKELEAAEDAQTSEKRPLRGLNEIKQGLAPAERGSAMHLAMQLIDFDACKLVSGAAKELSRLLELRIISAKQYAGILPDKITAFVSDSLGNRAVNALNMQREFKFSLLTAPSEYFPGRELAGERILLQGVIDLFFEEEDGLVLVDFKSDRIRLSDEERRAAEYKTQLEVYSKALTRITGKCVKEAYIWFFDTGRAVLI